MALDHPERRAKSELQGKFLPSAFRCCREALEQFQSFCEVTHRLMIRRALNRTLASALPVGDGLRALVRLRVVICQQFGLYLGYLWEPLF
jgi:hypothetical protein